MMSTPKAPNWNGDLVKCPFCRKGVFPHSHSTPRKMSDKEFATEPKTDPKVKATFEVSKAVKHGFRVLNDVPAPGAMKAAREALDKVRGKQRGRPMSAENIELLRICECQ